MKKTSLIFVLLICLIMPCCLFFTGCKDDDDGVLQLNTKYYCEESTDYIRYYIFTSKTKGHRYLKEVSSGIEQINYFIYEYIDEDAICYTYENSNKTSFNSATLLISKNFIVTTGNTIYVSENYLISFFSCLFLQLWENHRAVKGNWFLFLE